MAENKYTGGISVDTEHIFPIIKKWLYSEKDIFLREIVSNASDAITKLKRLESLGLRESENEKYAITVSLDTEEKTLTVNDNGIGMTAEEVQKYICNIALSGAVDFIQKYENESDSSNGIIGHFGLGFYSAFMVSNQVEVETKSYTDAPAVHWICNESGDYEVSDGTRTEHGTSIIMHISEDETEYLSKSKILEILNKYCAFMPVEIFFAEIDEDSDEPKIPEPINDTTPLWQKQPSECTKEEYIEFYHKVFNDFREPLFYVHINADYPLNFKGILYFPRITNDYESLEGEVKLYYNQVFVADNIKEVIPEYLTMLKGVLDCPELPLNVSRSYLQTNTYVSKLSAHITKKVADKLNSLAMNEREEYESIWKDIAPYIEYASMKEQKFYDRIKNAILLEITNGTSMTLEEYLNDAKESHENKIYYTNDKALQAPYVAMAESKGIKVALLERPIDVQFASFAEGYTEGLKFLRVDSNMTDIIGDPKEQNEKIKDLFASLMTERDSVEFASLPDESVPALLSVDEEVRRMEEMMRMYGMTAPTVPPQKLIINTACPLVSKLDALCDTNPELASEFTKYIYKLALLSQKKFTAEEMQEFMNISYKLLMNL